MTSHSRPRQPRYSFSSSNHHSRTAELHHAEWNQFHSFTMFQHLWALNSNKKNGKNNKISPNQHAAEAHPPSNAPLKSIANFHHLGRSKPNPLVKQNTEKYRKKLPTPRRIIEVHPYWNVKPDTGVHNLWFSCTCNPQTICCRGHQKEGFKPRWLETRTCVSEFQISFVWRNRREMRKNWREELAGAIQDAIAAEGGRGGREKRGRGSGNTLSFAVGGNGSCGRAWGGISVPFLFHDAAFPVAFTFPRVAHVRATGEQGVVEGRWYLRAKPTWCRIQITNID